MGSKWRDWKRTQKTINLYSKSRWTSGDEWITARRQLTEIRRQKLKCKSVTFIGDSRPPGLKVSTHDGTCCRVMSRGQIPSCEGSIFIKNLVAGTKFCPREMSPEFRSVWIKGTCRGDKTTEHARAPRVNCSCNMSPRHFRKINQSEDVIQASKTPSRNLSPQHAPSCEQRMKFFPETCSLVCAGLKAIVKIMHRACWGTTGRHLATKVRRFLVTISRLGMDASVQNIQYLIRLRFTTSGEKKEKIYCTRSWGTYLEQMHISWVRLAFMSHSVKTITGEQN